MSARRALFRIALVMLAGCCSGTVVALLVGLLVTLYGSLPPVLCVELATYLAGGGLCAVLLWEMRG